MLNFAQSRAVETTDGPVLIIAGPGTGKTFTLVERVFYLIQHCGVLPEAILVSTFTEKAAMELKSRISDRGLADNISINLTEMYIGTLHSICLRILKENLEFSPLRKNFKLFDQFEQQYFIYQQMPAFDGIDGFEELLGNHRLSRWRKSEFVVKWVNKLHEEMVTAETLLSAPERIVQILGRVFETYRGLLNDENALDFSSVQVAAVRLLEDNPDVLEQLQNNISYLMIDEYQDTNTIQEHLIFLLGKNHRNICVVGDDDQGLYRFRGATIRNILEFPDRFAPGECQLIRLETNYRSHPDIVDFFSEWMKTWKWEFEGKRFRFDKSLNVPDKTFVDTAPVIRVSGKAEDIHDTQNWFGEILAFLNTLRESGKLSDWNQVAFLFNSVKNRRVLALANFLESKGIGVYSPRSNLFFERDEIQLLIGAFLFLFPKYMADRKSLSYSLDVWDYYDRCFQKFGRELQKPENANLLRWAKPKALRHIELAQNTDYRFSELFYELLMFPLFSNFISYDDLENVQDSRSARNLGIFSKLLVQFEHFHHVTVLTPKNNVFLVRQFFDGYLRFLKDGGIDEYEDVQQYAPKGCVSFMTIHQSKGLEFPVVLVGSLENTPRKQHDDLDEILQAQYFHKKPFEPFEQMKFFDFYRLYYTAFSRAQHVLALSCGEVDTGKRRAPSKYLKPVYTGLPKWQDGEFDISKLDLNDVHGSALKQEYSFTSHILLFENCAQQYRFFKELAFAPVRKGAMLFGTLVHQTIEDIHKRALRGEFDAIQPDSIEQWFWVNYHSLAKRERTYLDAPQLHRALEHVLRYAEREHVRWGSLKEAEFDVALVKDRYVLRGTVDLIRGDDGTVEIIDFKSEKKPDLVVEREKVEQYRRQLEVYAHIVEERTGANVSKMHIYYTSERDGNPYVSFVKRRASIENTIDTFGAVVSRIEAGDFRISERPIKLCESCDMRYYCNGKY